MLAGRAADPTRRAHNSPTRPPVTTRLGTVAVFVRVHPIGEPLRWRHVSWDGQSVVNRRNGRGGARIFYRRVKTGKTFHRHPSLSGGSTGCGRGGGGSCCRLLLDVHVSAWWTRPGRSCRRRSRKSWLVRPARRSTGSIRTRSPRKTWLGIFRPYAASAEGKWPATRNLSSG